MLLFQTAAQEKRGMIPNGLKIIIIGRRNEINHQYKMINTFIQINKTRRIL